MNPHPAQTPSRRHFLTCAALTLGTAALARGQSTPAAEPSPDVTKAVKATQAKSTKSQARQLVRYLKPLVAKYGPGVIEDLTANTIDGAKNRFAKMNLPKRDLNTVKEQLWNKLDPDTYKVEKLEDTAESLKYRVTTCPWAAAYREADGAEIGFVISCAWDHGFCQGLNPAIKFTRTKTLMQGDDCCNHSYALSKPGAAPETENS